MGGCASTHNRNPPPLPAKSPSKSRKALVLLSGNNPGHPPRPAVVKVICQDGRVEEFKAPVKAGAAVGVAAGGGEAYLCSWESMYVDEWAPEVAEEEELKAGQVYFVMPKSKGRQPLSLHDMCALAIKASSVLSLADFHSSFRH